jgi:hypothetical protein
MIFQLYSGLKSSTPFVADNGVPEAIELFSSSHELLPPAFRNIHGCNWRRWVVA